MTRHWSCPFVALAREAFAARLGEVAFLSMSVFGKKPTISAVVLLKPSTGRWPRGTLAKTDYDPHTLALESSFT